MDKRRAIQIMTKAAQLYKEHLEDQKVLFLYGLPKEVNKQLQESNKILSSVQGYEVVFHRYNFLHLTGVRLNKKETASAIHFYQKCLDKRLTENDFVFAKDGSTGQKLDILERMMLIKKNVTMIGEFTDRGPKLYTEKAAGNICGCIGFVKDKNTKLNVPNTLLKKDIRDVTAQPTYKVFAVISKHYTDEKYTNLVKMDKSIDLKERCFVMKLDIINDLRKLPAEFFGQEYDSDLFVCDGALQSFLQLVVLMNDHTLYTGQSHSCQSINIVTDQIHFHIKVYPGS